MANNNNTTGGGAGNGSTPSVDLDSLLEGVLNLPVEMQRLIMSQVVRVPYAIIGERAVTYYSPQMILLSRPLNGYPQLQATARQLFFPTQLFRFVVDDIRFEGTGPVQLSQTLSNWLDHGPIAAPGYPQTAMRHLELQAPAFTLTAASWPPGLYAVGPLTPHRTLTRCCQLPAFTRLTTLTIVIRHCTRRQDIETWWGFMHHEPPSVVGDEDAWANLDAWWPQVHRPGALTPDDPLYIPTDQAYLRSVGIRLLRIVEGLRALRGPLLVRKTLRLYQTNSYLSLPQQILSPVSAQGKQAIEVVWEMMTFPQSEVDL